MPIKVTASTASQALDIASKRGILPTALGSTEARKTISKAIRRNSVFSAKTTNAAYLEALKKRIARLLQGGRNNDLPQIRLELKKELARLGYTPEEGFPGDEALGIEPAEAGSLKDLSSDIRLNLVLKTQEELMRGAAMKARGESGTRAKQFPAWELVRLYGRKVPRGSVKGSKAWPTRWDEAGGTRTKFGQMIALKGDPIWAALGNSTLFDDALDTDHPPFAFNSGMGWREVHHRDVPEEVKRGKSKVKSGEQEKDKALKPETSKLEPSDVIDKPKASVRGFTPEMIAALKKKIKDSEEKDGVLTVDSILEKGRAKP